MHSHTHPANVNEGRDGEKIKEQPHAQCKACESELCVC